MTLELLFILTCIVFCIVDRVTNYLWDKIGKKIKSKTDKQFWYWVSLVAFSLFSGLLMAIIAITGASIATHLWGV